MTNDILMVRIYLSEADHGKRKTLMQEVLTLLQDRHAVQGVTVFRELRDLERAARFARKTSCGSTSISRSLSNSSTIPKSPRQQ